MTLPDSEIKRIEKASCNYAKDITVTDATIIDGSKYGYFSAGATAEASLWYERMGKFAEWYSDNFNGVPDDYEAKEGEQVLTTPELINEFLQQENKQK